ncbi:putative trans-sialidase [Trypanosoma cruzi]|uniref:Trans-sialidase, putative n=1 Tax=Trypanosoma cruzi (strain CL Brener) TaxID=353153 RepID=Q4DUP2_TRYCC|nr:trans-sialidase, putative [Trypanosoma cruzi]EAN96241.1 trans-sialidase, putative [Trypanosoma cruzi]RNC40091.1 putative trans-sialidase [Trypanosoma cruzi]|eukprot:XP_818092.1 trans-sialidase [Trypanosoma cruzi strain CL Brener]
MLSRVAAVMAPRTPNRRRVTGSNGRRREGRESEPQRPNMSRHLFCSAVLLLVLVMMCCGTGVAHAEVQPSQKKFEWKVIKDEGGGVTVESLGAPGLLKVGSDVFAVAEAKNKEKNGQGSFTGIASQLLTETEEKKDNTPVEVLKDPKDTKFLEEDGSADSKKKVDVSRPTTVMRGNEIYMLVGKYSQAAASDQDRVANDGGLLLVQGSVCDEGGSGKRIKWKDNDGVSRISVGELDSWTGLTGGGGSGIEMEEGMLVFPVEGKKKEKGGSNDGKTVSLLIYSSEDTNKNWNLSRGMSDGGCGDPSVVEWKDKKLMMMTACDDGRRRVYESGDKGESWTEALGTLSRVWGNKKGEGEKGVRSGFITARIDGDENNRNVMLVTLPVYSEKADKKETDNGEKGVLRLWLTDNTHIVDIGPVSDDDAAASSLLYKSAEGGTDKKELIALYEKKKKGDEKPSPGMVSVLLTAQLQRVKEVLATWKKADDRVSKLCPSSDVEDASTGDACSPIVRITDGLVGFLSGNFSDGTWSDEYLGVNATVKNNDDGGDKATLHAGGVKFTGAWAEWPVGAQGENQLYHFANYNFTLVATVSIDKVPEGSTHIPLMGAKTNSAENTVLLGLSYSNNEKKWMLLCGSGNRKELSSALEPGKTRQLAIVLQNGSQGSAYVDGQRVGVGDAPCELKVTEPNEISHFYIGGDGNSAGGAGSQEGVSVTVTNVLLYNRPWTSEEIGALNPNKDTITSPMTENAPETMLQSPAKPQPSEDEPLKENIGAGVLSSAASTATTVSSDFAQEAATGSGDTMLGNGSPQTPEESVSSGEDGEDGETAEGTDVQGEGIHSQGREVNAAALSSSLGNVSQGNNSDACTVRGSRLLPLLLLLGLWGFAAL